MDLEEKNWFWEDVYNSFIIYFPEIWQVNPKKT